VTAPLVEALVRSLDEPEGRRALAVATAYLIGELEAWDPALCAQLTPALHEFGPPQAVAERGHCYDTVMLASAVWPKTSGS
jgi:hypothetical protein